MKQFLSKSLVLMFAALCCMLTSCSSEFVTQPEVAIQLIDALNPTSITVRFTPNEQVTRYVYAIGTANDKESFIDGTIPGKVIVPDNKEIDVTFEDLDASTQYVIYAMAYETAKVPLSTLQCKTYTDAIIVKTYYVGDNSAGFTISNSDDIYRYELYLGSADEKEKFLNDEIKTTTTVFEEFEATQNYFDLTPDTEYVFYLRAWGRDNVVTKLFEIPIKTAELNSEEIPNATIEIGEADFFSQNYTVTPNEKCKQVVLFQKRTIDYNEQIFGKNNYQGRLLKMFEEWVGFNKEDCYVAKNKVLKASPYTVELDNGVPLEVFVAICDETYKPVCIKKTLNSTPALNKSLALPKKDDFKMNILGMDSDTKTIEFSVDYEGNDMTAYFIDIVDKAWLDAELAKPTQDKHFLHNTLLARKNAGSSFLYKRNNLKTSIVDKDIKPKTTYYIAVCPMNANGPREFGWGDAVLCEFTTPESDIKP